MRHCQSRLVLNVVTPASVVVAVAVSGGQPVLSEHLEVLLDGAPIGVTELAGVDGNRLHVIDSEPGELVISYRATVDTAPPAIAVGVDRITYLRPSRYCDSDRLARVARTLFLGPNSGAPEPNLDLARRVRRWAVSELVYAPGTTDQIDGATEIFLSGQGVCRDTAHLVIAFCRALGIPARLVACYAPDLVPMDFHAVAEVLIDGSWYVLDGTGLANRHGLVRISTGRDAADTAFLEIHRGTVQLVEMSVDASSTDLLVYDDGELPVILS